MIEARCLRQLALAGLPLLALTWLAGCVGAPTDAQSLNGGAQVAQISESGLVDATVTLASATLARGQNRFLVSLRPTDDGGADAGTSSAQLTGAIATMPAHGHSVTASNIAADGSAFAADLDLFMSGLWQVDFAVAVGAQADHVVLSLDVP